MSTDPAVLAALARKAGAELHYFELVTLRCHATSSIDDIRAAIISGNSSGSSSSSEKGGPSAGKQVVYLCVGKHGVHFLQEDLSGPALPDGGVVYFAHVAKVIVDQNSPNIFLLVLNENRKLEATHVSVQAEHRSCLLQHMAVCFQTDHVWRLGKVSLFPKYEKEVTAKASTPSKSIQPFCGKKQCEYKGYTFFLSSQFKEIPNAVTSTKTGVYTHSHHDAQVMIRVHDPTPLAQLEATGKGHVRLLAMEYKLNLTEQLASAHLPVNEPYLKAANLSGRFSEIFKRFLKNRYQKYVSAMRFI